MTDIFTTLAQELADMSTAYDNELAVHATEDAHFEANSGHYFQNARTVLRAVRYEDLAHDDLSVSLARHLFNAQIDAMLAEPSPLADPAP